MTDRAAWMRAQFNRAARQHGVTLDGPPSAGSITARSVAASQTTRRPAGCG